MVNDPDHCKSEFIHLLLARSYLDSRSGGSHGEGPPCYRNAAESPLDSHRAARATPLSPSAGMIG